MRSGARVLAVAIVVGLLGTACATIPPPTPTATPLVTSPTPNASGALAVVVVRQHFAGEGFYIEGAVAFVEVYDEGGAMVAEAQTPQYHLDIEILRAAIPPGAYLLRSYVRPCAAACPHMDLPTDECTLDLSLDAGITAEVLIVRLSGKCVATVANP